MNLDYIRKKRKEKFSILWDIIVPNFPFVSAHDSLFQWIDLKDKRYYFNKKVAKTGVIYLVCRMSMDGLGEKIEYKKEYDKIELQEIFCDYAEFKKDTKLTILGLKDKLESQLSSEYDLKRKINFSIRRLKLQKEYAKAFFTYIGWSPKREELYASFNTPEEINAWINKSLDANFTFRYYEFLPYSSFKIKKHCNVSTNNILLNNKDSDFIDFCMVNGFNNLLKLIYIPYYSKIILEKFDIETIDRVIKEIKSYIDTHTW